MTAQPTNFPPSQSPNDTHVAGRDPDSPTNHTAIDAHIRCVGGATSSDPAIPSTGPKNLSPGRNPSPEQTNDNGSHTELAGEGANSTTSQKTYDAHRLVAGSEEAGTAPANVAAIPMVRSLVPFLADPVLALLADVLDDAEHTRKANVNRLRHLTTSGPDADGITRGLGLSADEVGVKELTVLVGALDEIEHKATLALAKRLRNHPLGPWVKAQKGIGDKQAARLLAVIGDPYVNAATGQPRTVAQLRQYCGHGDPNRRKRKGMSQAEAFALGNPTAKMRLWNIATSTIKQVAPKTDPATKKESEPIGMASQGHQPEQPQPIRVPNSNESPVGFALQDQQPATSEAANLNGTPLRVVAHRPVDPKLEPEPMLLVGRPSTYRQVYDQRRTATADRTHSELCVRCGPAGHPAPAGSPWSKAHQHADALRIVGKAILKDLWIEARRLHEEGDPA